jgi:hypothetical protein
MEIAGSLPPSGRKSASLLNVRVPVVVDCDVTWLDDLLVGSELLVEPQLEATMRHDIARAIAKNVRKRVCVIGSLLRKKLEIGSARQVPFIHSAWSPERVLEDYAFVLGH